MSRLTIDTGTEGNPATGDSLRGAFTKVNANFTELYTELGGDSLDAISFNNNTISTDLTNANLILTGNGTGGVVVEDLEITGSTINALTTNNNLTLTTNGTGKVIINSLSINEINSNDSSAIQVNDAINVSGQGTFNNTTKFNAGVTIGANVEPDGTYSRQLGTGDKRWVQIYTLNLDMVGSLTVDGTAGQTGQLLQSNGASYVPAWTSNITVNSIASSDSSAIQINDGLNVSGAIAASSIVADNLLTGIKTSTIVSGVLTLDFTFGTHIVNHNANITSITFTNASAVKSSQVTVILTQDATGGRTITGSYATAGGLGLDISTTASAVNIITFLTRDNSTFYGFSNGKNFS